MQKSFPLFPAISWLLLYLLVGKQIEAQTVEYARIRTPEAIREIKFLTAESTLLGIVRAHDLASRFNSADEAAAVIQLRDMIDLTEDHSGNALEIAVLSDDPGLAETLTNAVADASARQRADHLGTDQPLSSEDAAADLKVQETFIEAFRIRMMKVMKDYSIIDLSMARKQAPGGAPPTSPELPLEYLRAKRSYEQQLEVLNYTRRNLQLSVPKVDEHRVATTVPPAKSILNHPMVKKVEPKPVSLPVRAPADMNIMPESRRAVYGWVAGCILIVLVVLALLRRHYTMHRKR